MVWDKRLAIGRLLQVDGLAGIIAYGCFLLSVYVSCLQVDGLLRFTATGAALVAVYIVWFYRRYYYPGLVRHIQGQDADLDRVLAQCPTLLRGPRPPIWCPSSHLQFVPFMVSNWVQWQLNPIRYQRVKLTVHQAKCNESPKNLDPEFDEVISMDIWPPISGETFEGFSQQSPALLVAPGLRCHSQDIPGTTMIRWAHAHKLRTIVVNRRGHCPDDKLKAPRFNLFGDVNDMEQVYRRLRKPDLLGPDTPLFLVGVSSGSALAINCCSRWDERRNAGDTEAPHIVAGIAICPGYDLRQCMGRFPEPYQSILLQAIKDHFLQRNAAVLQSFNKAAYDRVMATSNMQGFVDEAAPFAGYRDTDSYYTECNPVLHMHKITSPMMIITTEDDPCCVIGVHESSPYDHHASKSYSALVGESKLGLLAITRSGSHCPFLDGVFNPFVRDPLGCGGFLTTFMQRNWVDAAVVEWCNAWRPR